MYVNRTLRKILRERERERDHEQGRGRGRERGSELRQGLMIHDPGIVT